MMCDDHGRFLEIADVIHRLELTILKGVMEKRPESTWAQFIVEVIRLFIDFTFHNFLTPFSEWISNTHLLHCS